MSALIRKSITDITRRKVRSLLIILGIMISVLGLTSIFTASDTIYSALSYSADQSTVPDVEFLAEGGDEGYQLTDELKAVSNVKLLQMDSLNDLAWQIQAAPGTTTMAIYGYRDFQHISIMPFELLSGRYPGKGEIVLEASDSAIQPVSIGNYITIDTHDSSTRLKVVGFSRTLGLRSPATTGLAQGYVSDDTVPQLQGRVADHIQVKVYDTRKISQTISALTDVLVAHNVQVANVHQTANTFDQTRNSVNGFILIVQILAIGALILTCFLIINIISTLITEQTKIIGTMKALGGTRGKIIRNYLLSVLIYSLIATALGIPLGLFIGYQITFYVSSLITLVLGPYTLSPWLLVVSLGTGIIVPLLAALIPIWNGTRITVRQALSAYGVSVGRQQERTSPSRWSRVFNWLPQTFALGWRGTFRKRGRATLTLAALVLSGIAFLSVQIATYSVQQHTDTFYASYNYDVWATFKPGPKTDYVNLLQSVSNIKRIESFSQDEFNTKWGILQVNAVEPDTQMYRHQLLSGHWLSNNETNVIVLSDDVLARTGLHLGDSIKVTDRQGNSANWKIIGTVHDVSGDSGALGIGVTSVSILNQLKGVSSDTAWGLLIQGDDRSPGAIDSLSTDVSEVLTQARTNDNVISLPEAIQRIQSQFQPISLLLYVFASLIACVGLLALINLLTTSVLERKREIGVLRAVGATGRTVASVFWIEGASLSMLAWLLGIALGLPTAYTFVTLLNRVLLPVSFAFDPLIIVEMLAIIMVIMTIACIGPALSASRTRIVDILRYE